MRKADPTGCHCLAAENCCTTASPAHATCYRAQCFKTVAAFVRQAGVPEGKYSVAFQSRLGREPWLKPYTDFELPRLAQQGVRKLLVMCPAFVSDCLETLEEIGLRGRQTFLEGGGLFGKISPAGIERMPQRRSNPGIYRSIGLIAGGNPVMKLPRLLELPCRETAAGPTRPQNRRWHDPRIP